MLWLRREAKRYFSTEDNIFKIKLFEIEGMRVCVFLKRRRGASGRMVPAPATIPWSRAYAF